MLEKIVTLYRKAEMGIISGLSSTSANIINENSFYDIGYMQTQIARIQKELKSITAELETALEVRDASEYSQKQITRLMKHRENLLFQMIFLASNSFQNLEYCENLAEGHSFVFMQCVKGLKEYQVGNKENAFRLLEAYFHDYGNVEEHYLVNKIFGLLLVEKQNYPQAIVFLTYALQLMPDDVECLKMLKVCYRKLKEYDRENVINEILLVLDAVVESDF